MKINDDTYNIVVNENNMVKYQLAGGRPVNVGYLEAWPGVDPGTTENTAPTVIMGIEPMTSEFQVWCSDP